MKYIGDAAFYKRVAKIALPVIIQNGVSFMINFIDNIMVGQLGTEAMSGVAIVNQLIFVFNTCILGIIAGASIFGAQFYGNGNKEGLKETFRFRIITCVLLAVAAMLIFWLAGDKLIMQFLHSQNDSGEIMKTFEFGENYLAILIITLIPSALTQAYASTSKDMGETFLPMCSSVAAVVLNTVLNYILIFGKFGFPELGVEGAAIATVIARFFECLIIVIVTHVRKNKYTYIDGAYRTLKISSALAKKIVIKGSPLMINEMFWSVGTVMMTQCYSERGIDVIAGINIASTVFNIFSILYIAIGSSIAILIGQLLGADRMEEARDTDNKLIFLTIVSSAVIAVLMAVIAPMFPRLYNTSDEVRALATSCMYILAFCMPVASYVHAAFFTIRAGGKTFITFLFDSSVLWLISIPLAFCLTRFTDMNIVMIYLLCQMTEIIKLIIGFILVKKGVWLKKIVS